MNQPKLSKDIARAPMKIHRSVLNQIYQTIGKMPAEQGGALGGSREDGIVRHYHFDHSAHKTGATYSPDYKFLNRLFSDVWNPAGINLLGFVHSHPSFFFRPSHGDEVYAKAILEGIPDLDQLLLPIIQTEADTGEFKLHPYVAIRNGRGVRVERLELTVIEDEAASHATRPNHQPVRSLEPGSTMPSVSDMSRTFSRVEDAYDLEHLRQARVIAIGTGGGAHYLEETARTGVGEFVLIDPDVVSETNLATQQVYRRDLGRPKVSCLAERIRDINPNAIVVERQVRLEEISDQEFHQEFILKRLGNQSPTVTLLCGLTDNFETQARVNRLALHFGLPSICAQVYQQGQGAEITFTVPGSTPACHRCALNSRYKAYLEQGFINHVTSHGTPIFSTTRLNALKGFITLAILHGAGDRSKEPQGERWIKLLNRIGNRNLVLIRMDPDVSQTLGLSRFDTVFQGGDTERILTDDVIWLPQLADSPETGFPNCLDCGGTGNLHHAKGTFADTRHMRI